MSPLSRPSTRIVIVPSESEILPILLPIDPSSLVGPNSSDSQYTNPSCTAIERMIPRVVAIVVAAPPDFGTRRIAEEHAGLHGSSATVFTQYTFSPSWITEAVAALVGSRDPRSRTVVTFPSRVV